MMKYLKSEIVPILATIGILTIAPCGVEAVSITAVAASDLGRPVDNVAYPFDIVVSGIYSAADIILGMPPTFTVEYWDDETFDDPIDLLTGVLVVPAAGAGSVAGAPWGPVTVPFAVGCQNPSSPEVFGPSGRTGENPMDDGYFFFPNPLGRVKWGYNTVATGEELKP